MTRPSLDNATYLIGGSVVTFLALWFFALVPIRGNFATIQKDTAEERSRLQTLEAQRIDPQAVLAEQAAVTEKYHVLQQYFFDSSNALELFSQIERLAEERGVAMEFSLENGSGSSTDAVELRFTLSGPYQNTVLYLQALEHLSTILRIDEVQMSDQGGGRIATTLTAQVFALENSQ